MKYFIRVYKGIEHKVLGSEDDRKVCDGCNLEFNQKNFHIASPKVNSETQEMYKRLKNKCKDCENKLRGIRHALEKDPSTPPKPKIVSTVVKAILKLYYTTIIKQVSL